MRPLLDVILMIGMLVVVPAGLRLTDVAAPVRRMWWLGAVPGAASLWLERGLPAALLASAYLLVTVVLAVQGLVRLTRPRAPWPVEAAVLTALVTPGVAAVALVAERAGHPLWGFGLGILALTVAHFHFAGFAAALVAGLVCRAAGDTPLARAAALSVPGGTLAVLAGYFVGEWAELAGAVVLTAGMWLVGLHTLTSVRRGTDDRLTRVLLAVSAVVVVLSMPLALSWALGEATGLPKLPIDWMVATHGLANAAGFALCGLAAWLRLRPRPL